MHHENRRDVVVTRTAGKKRNGTLVLRVVRIGVHPLMQRRTRRCTDDEQQVKDEHPSDEGSQDLDMAAA